MKTRFKLQERGGGGAELRNEEPRLEAPTPGPSGLKCKKHTQEPPDSRPVNPISQVVHRSDPRVGVGADPGRALVAEDKLGMDSEARACRGLTHLASPPWIKKKKVKDPNFPSSCLIQLQDTPHPAENSPGNSFAL